MGDWWGSFSEGLADAWTPVKDAVTGGGFWDNFTSPNVLSSAITAGAGLFGGMSQLDANEEALKASKENQKLQYLLELAKLKYGQKGGGGKGGGGSQRNKNADLIEVLMKSSDSKNDALDKMARNYIGALK